IAEGFDSIPTEFDGFHLPGEALEQELEAGGYFDIAAVPEMGPICAALAVERLARLPCTAEIALSMLVRPQVGDDLPRPFALVEKDRPGRFVAGAGTLLVLDGDDIGITHPAAGDTEAVESLYAYPMGRLTGALDVRSFPAEEAAQTCNWLRVACAAEMAGLMQAALDATVEHTSVRKQFGRPLGTFQALRHRMAECAVLVAGVRRLALQAAWSGDAGDAALAAFHAQDSASKITYDLHQMFGAMGMTLEMSLHLWTYRMKALSSELGGLGAQAAAVATDCFTADQPY
ncbi:MAG: acyl-CoA dehydrogenase, partial [Halioglobus sp.]|nr:acyl-CoA dehydrogenase [Halioglobus sp.]